MKNKTYEYLKIITQYLLPAICSIYFGLSLIFELPYVVQIIGNLSTINVVLGIILRCNKATDGSFMIDTSDIEKDTYRLQLDTPLDELGNKKSIVLKIQNGVNLNNT